MASITLSDLRNLVYYWVDDSQGISTGSGGYFTTVQVNKFLNNAAKEVQKKLISCGEMYYLKVVETTMATNQQDYLFPSDFLKSHRIETVLSGTTNVTQNKNVLDRITLMDQDNIQTLTGVPSCYDIKKDRFSLYPIPDASQSGKTLRLYYSYLIIDMVSDNDVADVPDEFKEYVAILAALDCFVKDERAPQNLLDKRETYEKRLIQLGEDRDESSSRTIRVTGSDGFGALF